MTRKALFLAPLPCVFILLMNSVSTWASESSETSLQRPAKAIPLPVVPGGFVAFSPDSRYYVTSTIGHPPAMFETRTGQMVRKFALPPGWGTVVDDAIFSPDGKILALMASPKSMLDDPKFMLVDPFGNKLPKQLKPQPIPGARQIAFSPAGAFVASWYYSTPDFATGMVSRLGRWDLATGALLPGERVLADWPDGIAISADGKYLLVEYILKRPGSGRPQPYKHWIEIWDLETLSKLGDLLPPQTGPKVAIPYLMAMGLDKPGQFRIRILPNGKSLFFPFARTEYAALSSLKTVQVLDAVTQQPLVEIDDLKRGTILRPVLSPDHRFVAVVTKFGTSPARLEFELHVWNVAKAVERRRLQARNRSEQDWNDRWTALGQESVDKAYSALCDLYSTPEASCDYVKKRLASIVLPKDPTGGPVTVTAELLRAIRIIEVLEQMNTAKAAEILHAIASGEPGTWLASEAQAALQRLGK